MSVMAVQSTRKTVLLFVLLFLIMTSGVAAGIFLATKFGFVTWAKQVTLVPTDLQNKSSLVLGTALPDYTVTASDGSAVGLRSIVDDRRCIVAYVSNGCDACDEFLAAVQQGGILPANSQLILLSEEPEHFAANYSYSVFGVDQSFLEQCGIYTSPTIVGVDREGYMRVICSGFTELLTASFMEESLE